MKRRWSFDDGIFDAMCKWALKPNCAKFHIWVDFFSGWVHQVNAGCHSKEKPVRAASTKNEEDLLEKWCRQTPTQEIFQNLFSPNIIQDPQPAPIFRAFFKVWEAKLQNFQQRGRRNIHKKYSEHVSLRKKSWFFFSRSGEKCRSHLRIFSLKAPSK